MNQLQSEMILDSILDGVMIVDREGKIIYANKAAEGLISQAAIELTGAFFGYPLSSAEVQEIEIYRNQQLLTVQMLATWIQWNDQRACLLSIRDITALKKATRELELQKARLENLNGELEQYASLASHDLKEPVRKIIFYSEKLLGCSHYEPVETVKKELGKILGSANRMKSLIGGIAEFAKSVNPTDDFQRVDLNEVLQEVLADLELSIAEKNAEIVYKDLPTIEAIRIQMHQLFLNLILNAIKYAKENERPRIRIENQDLGDRVEIQIIDNGVGFENGLAEKIFQPFQRLKATKAEGSGIGLTICKKIVQLHGGEINVKSVPGDGSRFIFTLARSG